jgi:CubicO group peptidase (beta-lactamase class C family)
MEPDKYQQAWQANASQTRVTVDANLLLKEVQRSQRNFRVTIFCRDFREVVVALLLIPLWFYLGARNSSPWTWYLTVPALIWIIGFILADRMRHKRKSSEPGDPLLQSVQESLIQVEHQIWLLRNVFWWYLLPPTISISAFFAHVAWQASKNWLEALGSATFLFFFLCALYYFIDYINQRAVRLQLEPRRQELLVLLESLGDESTDEYATMDNAKSIDSPRIFKRWLIVAVLAFATYLVMTLFLTSGLFDSSYDGPSRSSGPGGDSLAKLVAEQRKEKNLVGLAAMVMVDGQVEAAAANGERKKGSGVALEIGDRWHLGSITKSITATMIARLIESGQLKWSITVGECFLDAPIHEDWKPVTLKQLLTHTAGAPANFSLQVRLKQPALGPECTQARREAVLDVIADKPAYPPGKKHAYSNVGYTIAGAMAEKVTGTTWEDLVKQEVFDPLKLTEAGFGPPNSPDETLPQPHGHRKALVGKVSVDDKADNTPIMGPSGIIHMTLRDLCNYANEHLRGELGTGKLLSTETYKLLQTPALDNYACGWVVKKPTDDIPYTVYWHNGSNTMWYALVVFIPEKNMVVAVTANDGDVAKAETAAWEVVKARVKQFNVGTDPPHGEQLQGADDPK